jgi:hypothetical protein
MPEVTATMMLLQIPLLAKPSYTPSDFIIGGAYLRSRGASADRSLAAHRLERRGQRTDVKLGMVGLGKAGTNTTGRCLSGGQEL